MPKTDVKTIPGIGKNMELHLRDIGYDSVESLVGQTPEIMYQKECIQHGGQMDRCVLYAYRCAVYYAEGGREPEKLKWWNWKD